MAMRLAPVMSFVVALALLFPPGGGTAHACTCATPPSDETRIKQMVDAADVIVAGEIVSRHPVNADDREEWLAIVEVGWQYKGTGARRVAFTTDRQGASCGYAVDQPGDHLLVLYAGEDGALTTSSCSSMPVQGIEEGRGNDAMFLAALDDVAPPQAFARGDPPPGWIVAAYIAGSLLLLTGIVAVRKRA